MSTRKVIFKVHGTTFFIEPSQVLYVQAEGSYCSIKMLNGENIRLSKNLKFVLNQFFGVDYLYKIHRSYAINLNYIDKILSKNSKSNSFSVHLITGDVFSMTQKEQHKFFEVYKDLNEIIY